MSVTYSWNSFKFYNYFVFAQILYLSVIYLSWEIIEWDSCAHIFFGYYCSFDIDADKKIFATFLFLSFIYSSNLFYVAIKRYIHLSCNKKNEVIDFSDDIFLFFNKNQKMLILIALFVFFLTVYVHIKLEK